MGNKILLAKDSGLREGDTITADRLFMFFAYARSGHHAIVEYIGKQFSGDVFHLNYCDWDSNRWLGFKDTHTPFGDKRAASLVTSNYENFDLRRYDEERARERTAAFITNEPQVIKSVIMRDPYNHFASWYNRQRHVDMTPAKYIQHAKEFLGETDYLGANVVHVNYNKWCIDPEYRKGLFESFGGDAWNDDIGYVPPWAGGSTFDNLSMQGKGGAMKVRQRWKQITNQDAHAKKGYLFDEGVIEYACKIHSREFIMPIVDALRKRAL